MALDHGKSHNQISTQAHMTTPTFRQATSRRGLVLRRRKLPSVRLGGKRPGRMLVLVKMFRKTRLRWLKLQYMFMLRKLKEYYKNLLKDLSEAGASIETFQQRVFMESTFALPVGVSFSNYPSIPGSDRPRTIF